MNGDQHINIHNYESWLLLYVDNELSEQQKQQVLAFIQDKPELKAELDSLLATVNIADESISFSKKSSLFIDASENDLTDEQLILFLDKEADENTRASIEAGHSASLKNRLDDLKKTYSVPDESIKYAKKELLYKKQNAVNLYRWLPRVAAAVAALAIGFWLFDNNPFATGESTTDLASVEIQNDSIIKTDTTGKEVAQPVKDTVVVITKNEMVKRADDVLPVKKMNAEIRSVAPVEERNEIETALVETPVEIVTPKHQPVIEKNDPVAGKQVTAQAATPVKQEPVITRQPDRAVAQSLPEREKRKKGFFRSIAENVKGRAIDVLSDDNENINVAGFAINIKK